MALAFSEKVRCSLGHRAFRAVEVTCDGTNATITASALDLTTIDCAIIASVDDIVAVLTIDLASINDAAQTVTSVNTTGIVVGDQVMVAASIDVVDLLAPMPYAQAADEVDLVVHNETGEAVDLDSTAWRSRVIRHTGLSVQSGTYITMAPIPKSAEVIVVWAIGTGQ